MSKDIWYVVTIHEADGHDFDGIFMTNDYESLDYFASTLDPLPVTFSRYTLEQEARDFFFEISDGFIKIDPLNYIDYLQSAIR